MPSINIFVVHFTAPVYKPAPSPYGEARQILTPDSSVKKYSFKILEPVEEARQSKAIEPQTNSINELIPDYDDEEISTEGDLFLSIYIFAAALFYSFYSLHSGLKYEESAI